MWLTKYVTWKCIIQELGVFAKITIESALLFVFKKCPPSTQTFSHTFRRGTSFSHSFWQGNALVHALIQRARKSSPLLVLMESISSYLHDYSTNNIISSKKFKKIKKIKKIKKKKKRLPSTQTGIDKDDLVT